VSYHLDPSDPTPVFRQIARQIRADIRTGVIPAGATLPTREELTEAFGVSPATVAKAISVLHDEGLTVSRYRKGTIVRATGTATTAARERTAVIAAAALESIVDAITSAEPHPLPYGFADALRTLAAAKDRWSAEELYDLADLITEKCVEVSTENDKSGDH
jgi:DNA-binding GntR family transcriptional regulator